MHLYEAVRSFPILTAAGTRAIFEVLRSLARTRQTTIVITEHKLGWLASFVDRLIVLHAGRVAADGVPRRVLSEAASQPWGVGATVYTRAAQEGRRLGHLAMAGDPLPVTLEQALETLR